MSKPSSDRRTRTEDHERLTLNELDPSGVKAKEMWKVRLEDLEAQIFLKISKVHEGSDEPISRYNLNRR